MISSSILKWLLLTVIQILRLPSPNEKTEEILGREAQTKMISQGHGRLWVFKFPCSDIKDFQFA